MASTPSSAATQVFDNPAGRIWYHPEGYVRLDWHRTPGREAHVRALYEAATQALQQYGSTRILSDHRHMPPLSPGLQRWLAEVWVPSAVEQAGYNRGAVVQAFNLFNRMATAQIVSQLTHMPVAIAHFDNDQEAERWVLADE